MTPRVTILVTCKNNVKTIEKCVESLLNQEYSDYGIFFVDAFSNDGTYEILGRYAKDKKIILRQIKGNAPVAYNYALKHIGTKITALIDADCVADRKWLTELVKPFEDKTVNATAGIALNPRRTESTLQYVIGKELEHRYRNFPKMVSRAPNMNLCIKTKIGREIRFNPKFDVSYDADFGYRMTSKYGNIAFTEKAIVYHYHRATWKKYFKQQLTYAKFVPLVYARHRDKMRGDHISTPSMLGNIINLYLIFLFALLSPISLTFLYLAVALKLVLLASFSVQLGPFMEKKYFLYYLFMFLVRTFAWCLGLPIGVLRLIRT